MNKLFSFLTLPTEHLEYISEERRDLYRTLFAALTYIPLTAAFNFTGFLIIFILAQIRLLDYSDIKLMLFPLTLLVVAILQYPLIYRTKEEQLTQTGLIFITINTIVTASQVFFWKGIPGIILIFTLIGPLAFFILRGFSITAKTYLFGLGLSIAAAIYALDNALIYSRIPVDSLTSMAGLIIYGTVLLTLIILIVSTTATPFQTIASRLIITFAFITTLSAVTTLLIGALTSFFHDRERTYENVKAVSDLKAQQIQSALVGLETNLNAVLEDAVINQRIQYLLSEQPNSLLYRFNYDLVKASLQDVQAQSPNYDEILLVDRAGNVILSTLRENEKQYFGQRPFFQRTMLEQNYAIETDYPGTTSPTIIFTRSITNDTDFLGVFAARGKFETITQIVQATAGLDETLESYLVSSDYLPLSKTVSKIDSVRTQATDWIIRQRYDFGQGIYENYRNETVIGYYQWIPDLEATLITEVEQSEVVSGVINLLLTNLSVGFFTTIMAFAIVFVTSRSISAPIVLLADKARALTNGNFSARIEIIDRQDEIGSLSNNFNKMAEELQGLVQNLEQKVEERTQDLQKQASRLRLAAEVARDATSSNNLDDLLARSAELLHDRFGFYHTGIFLIDNARENAILRAAPTEAGKKMIEQGYRIRIGQNEFVGQVADTGEARIAHDTDWNVTFTIHPLLPKTRSEAAIPLKVTDLVIGVLDVQSEEPGAFTQDDVAVLQTMADQLALAIQRAQLVTQLESNLREIEHTYQEMTTTSWQEYTQSIKRLGYQFDGVAISAIHDFPEDARRALTQGRSVRLTKSDMIEGAAYAIPLKLRDQAIGAMEVKFATPAVNQETLALIEETANRLALALENARLYADTQKRAERDRLIGEISTRISTSFNVDNILRATVEEFGKMLPDAEIIVELERSKEN